jgi:uncharacterized membrane protein
MNRRHWALGLVLLAIAWIASAALYPTLPRTLPTHWNIQGEPDAYGDKSWAAFLVPTLMLVMVGVFRLLPWLSPRHFEIEPFRGTSLFVMNVILAMMAFIHALMLYAGWAGGVDVGRWLIAGMFLFFALLGNVLGKVRRNFYIGVRTPWTLASERVWNDTHRMAAWVFVAGGVIGFALALAGLVVVSFGVMVGFALIPVVYSFVHYKRLEQRGEV